MRILLSVILLLLTAQAGAAPKTSPERQLQCVDRGGIFLADESCVCPISNAQIDPAKSDCLGEMVQWINQVSLGEAQACQNVVVAPWKKDKALQAFADPQFCLNPAKNICDPNLNPAVRDYNKAGTELAKIGDDAFESPRLQTLVEEVSSADKPEKTKICSSDRCWQTLRETIAATVYNPDRKSKVQEIFTNAQNRVIRLLENRILLLRARGLETEKSLKFLERSIEKVKAAELEFDPTNTTNLVFALSDFDRKVTVGGMVKLVDRNPFTIQAMLLHELGHIAGLSAHFGGNIGDNGGTIANLDPKPYDPAFPFDRELSCLNLDDTLADPACLMKSSEFYRSNGNKALADGLRKAAEIAKINPRFPIPFAYPDINGKKAPTCPAPKHEEALADLFMAEALAGEFDYTESPVARLKNQAIFQAATALFCANMESVHNSNLEKIDPHPTIEYRINRLFFAHPGIRKGLGCPAADVSVNGKSKGPKYCGDNLYPSRR